MNNIYRIDKGTGLMEKSNIEDLRKSAVHCFDCDTIQATVIAQDTIKRNGYFVSQFFIYGTKENLQKYFKV